MSIILVDTTGLWAIVFEDSKYHRFIIKELAGKRISVLDIQILELIRIVYKSFSEGGRHFQKGFSKIMEISEFIESRAYEIKGIKLNYIKTRPIDYINALRIIGSHKNLFIREGPKDTRWPEIIDAIIAYKWYELKCLLYTKDDGLIEFGRANNLKYIPIRED